MKKKKRENKSIEKEKITRFEKTAQVGKTEGKYRVGNRKREFWGCAEGKK